MQPIKNKVAVGQEFGLLTVLQNGEKSNTKVLVRCICSVEKMVSIRSLIYRQTVSCGRCNAKTHGMSKTKINIVWYNMMHRCYRPINAHYKNYGGRGISVCKRWHSFENFYQDLGDVPKGLTLDRIDNDGNYELTNVRWATMSQQIANQRDKNVEPKQNRKR